MAPFTIPILVKIFQMYGESQIFFKVPELWRSLDIKSDVYSNQNKARNAVRSGHKKFEQLNHLHFVCLIPFNFFQRFSRE